MLRLERTLYLLHAYHKSIAHLETMQTYLIYVMPIYNLLKYSEICYIKSGGLCSVCAD